MRCNNCGWDNAPGSSVCVKCGHPLQAGGAQYQDPYQGVNVPNYQGGEAMPRPTVINAQQAEPAPRPTRIVSSAELQNVAGLHATVSQTPKSCPHCGYPVVGDFTSCPNCGASLGAAPTAIQQPIQQPMQQPVVQTTPTPPNLGGEVQKVAKDLGLDIEEEVKCEKCGTMVSIDFCFCPKCGERIHLPTVRAIKHKPVAPPEPPKPKCRLTIIPEEGETTEAISNDYEGDSIILNRENTEKDNRTITSKEQAELICEDGKWYVLNHSELGSTYLEANRKLAIEPGDVIVLGDRRFRFEPQNDTD